MAGHSTSNSEVIALYGSFPFSTDEGYQQGLTGILTGGALDGKSDAEQAQILRLSRVFYFNRVTGNSITAEDVLSVEEAVISGQYTHEPSPHPSHQTNPQKDAPRTLSFSELKELIEQGKTDEIPNNRIVPDDLNEDAPSESKAPVRAKPWELLVEDGGSGDISRAQV